MGALDQIKQMQQTGLSEQEISNNLLEQGVTPKEITDAFAQAKIKEAVEREESFPEGPVGSSLGEGSPESSLGEGSPEGTAVSSLGESSLGEEQSPFLTSETYAPSSQEMPLPYSPQEPSYSQPYPQETPQPPFEETESYYPQEGYGSPGAEFGTDTIIEVAEQVFEEKIKKLSQQISNFKEFSAIAETKFSNFESRLKKIESIIENLQIKILEKIGSYGQGLESIKKEMSMMQDSFSKTLPMLAKPYMEKSAKKTAAAKKNSKK